MSPSKKEIDKIVDDFFNEFDNEDEKLKDFVKYNTETSYKSKKLLFTEPIKKEIPKISVVKKTNKMNRNKIF